MAIVQISRITQRKGLQEDLPQLAGAEFGWSVDERRLWIGNGTLEEGAPVVGNTEILTEFSDILNFTTVYTYKGEAAGYTVQTGATAGSPVTVSLQSWLDQFASVLDFGAVGDGVTDDTAAINRALYQLFCRETNPQIRRSLFFPAGVYKVTESIVIPPYATLYGEGADNSVIKLITTASPSAANAYVARTGDSLQQTGASIGSNSATPPQSITVSNLGFESAYTDADVFLVEDAVSCVFSQVRFAGPLTTSTLTTAADDISCIRFASTASLVTSQIKFENCQFENATYGINTDQQVQGVSVTASNFQTLYQGVVLGDGTPVLGGPTGFSITTSDFDSIYAEGIVYGDVSLNGSAQNVFFDVGNHFGGVTQPYTVIIDIQSDNNISVGDMFERSAVYATTYPRIRLNNTASIAFTNAEQLAMGTYVRETGQLFTMNDGVVSPASTIFTISTSVAKAFAVNYTILRDTAYRTGVFTVASDSGSSDLNYNDDYVENIDTGVTLSATQSGTSVSVKYTTSSSGDTAQFTYSVTRLA